MRGRVHAPSQALPTLLRLVRRSNVLDGLRHARGCHDPAVEPYNCLLASLIELVRLLRDADVEIL